MRIKSEKGANLMVVFCFLALVIVCSILYWICHAPLTYVLLVFLIPTVMWLMPYWYATCQELILDRNGCTVHFLFLTFHYSWSDFSTVAIEHYADRINQQSPYDSAVILSLKPISKPRWMKPHEYACFSMPGSFLFFYFIPVNTYLLSDKLYRYPLIKCVDRELFNTKMKEWNIHVINN